MKLIVFFVLFILVNVLGLAQNRLFDMIMDKSNNIYVVGSFDETIDLGNNTQITSSGQTDVFVGKYDATGKCQWGIKIGGVDDDEAGGITIDSSGNIIVTGCFIGEATIGENSKQYTSNKSRGLATLFVAKINPSGDPLWFNFSTNKLTDVGIGITSDRFGNCYVAGNYEGEIIFDGKKVKSNGKHDICIIKLDVTGNCSWIKTYGDQEDNLANTIYYDDKNLVLGGNSHAGLNGFTGYVAKIDAETGKINWTKNIGKIKGHIEKIIHDKNSSYYITGSIEGKDLADESYHCFVSKVDDKTGKDKWIKSFESNQAKGNDMVCDTEGNVYITGSFLDSIHIDKTLIKGKELEDIFLIKLNPDGDVLLGEDYGHLKSDIGRKLFYKGNSLIMAGEFTNDIGFGTTILTGGENTFFVAFFDSKSTDFKNAKVLANHLKEPKQLKNLTTISGRIIIEKDGKKTSLTAHEIHIEEDDGTLLKSTITYELGNFSFKNMDTSKLMSLVVKKNERIKENDQVYLAKLNGTIIQKFNLDVDYIFRFKLLNAAIIKLSEPDLVSDPLLSLDQFDKSSNAPIVVVENILYPNNSFTVPQQSTMKLDEIAEYMIRNQGTRLVISSHTDAKGSDDYNLELSKKRAIEVKKYISNKGIQPSRIKAVGFGESKIINRCKNDVDCSEEETAVNRRTEFTITK